MNNSRDKFEAWAKAYYKEPTTIDEAIDNAMKGKV